MGQASLSGCVASRERGGGRLAGVDLKTGRWQLRGQLNLRKILDNTGGVNAPLRDMLRLHRGMSTLRRVKAVFWWCHMHSENPMPPAEILAAMPTDDDIAELYRRTVYEPQKREGPVEWGDGLVWAELRHSSPWRMDWD